VAGTAEILGDNEDARRLTDSLQRKYGVEFRLVMAVERLVRSGQARRVILRITPA
jgi:hypothetical protein